MTRALLRRLARDGRGATMVEFAIIAPVLFMLIMGLSEIAYQAYVQSVLTGAIQKAGRDSTIQGNNNNTDALDQKVMQQVWRVAGNATYVSSRKNYSQFSNVGPEYFFDDNGNGHYDKDTECFTDVNGNHTWDVDPGRTGQGGANDVVVYKLTVTYPHIFPIAGWFRWGATTTLSASTVLKNQPYQAQAANAPVKVCPS